MPAFSGVGRGLLGGIPGALGGSVPGAPGGVAGTLLRTGLKRKSKKPLTPEQQAELGTNTLGTAATGGLEVGTRLGRSRGY